MIEVQVAMTDLYGSARFSVETAGLYVDELKRAIEDAYETWYPKLSHQGAGTIMVSYRGYRVATGSIAWWWNGTRSIQLEAASMEWVGGTSARPEDYPLSAQTQTTCCAPA